MPGGDGTGPNGFGPGTGWGRGPCSYGRDRSLGRRRFWRNRGVGFGRGGYNSSYEKPVTPEEEKNFLEMEAKGLETELKIIQKRIKDLESKE